MDRIPDDSLELVLEARLLKLLDSLPPDYPSAPVAIQARLAGATARLWVCRGGGDHVPEPTGPELSSCQRDCLAAVRGEIARQHRRVVGSEIRAVLATAGKRWATSTINQALADLVARQLVVNDRDRRGYGLPDDDAGPL